MLFSVDRNHFRRKYFMKAETKNHPINIRDKPSQIELIDIAAKFQSKSRTDFILEASMYQITKSEDVLLDQRLFLVNDEQMNGFNKAIEISFNNNVKSKLY